MRYLCFVKMDERILKRSGAYDEPGVKEAVEFRVRGGSLTVTDGPYTEAKEVIGGWAIIKVGSEEEARAEGQKMADIHLEHWPTWEGSIEIRRIAEPEEAPTGS